MHSSCYKVTRTQVCLEFEHSLARSPPPSRPENRSRSLDRKRGWSRLPFYDTLFSWDMRLIMFLFVIKIVISVAPSPSGGLFATGSGDMRARIWRLVYFLSLPNYFSVFFFLFRPGPRCFCFVHFKFLFSFLYPTKLGGMRTPPRAVSILHRVRHENFSW